MKLLHIVDNFLNKITMYRVILYSLIIMSAAAIFFGFLKLISYNPLHLIFSASLLVLTCYVSNLIFAKIFKAVTNSESSLITGLILFLIMPPADNLQSGFILFLAGIIAMASKYVLARRKKHIFNPAAFASVVLGYLAGSSAIWWVTTPILLPITVILGFLIVRKIRRFTMFFSYFIPAFICLTAIDFLNNQEGLELIKQAFTAWPLVFFGTVMFTEPRTMPPTRKHQIIYGLFVGIFSSIPFRIGPIFSTPELILLIGNIFSYLVSPKQNFLLRLLEVRKLAPDIYGFSFVPDQKPQFAPGQYLEWTLPHKNSDSRGNRRYFTIASSPTEDEIKLGVKISEESSSFKKALLNIKSGTKLSAGSLAGDFTLHQNTNEKLVFIAGGIGVTPFRSMVQYLIDTKQKRDIVFFYISSTTSDFVYKEIFDKASYSNGLKIIYAVTKPENAPSTWSGKTGRLNEEMIKQEIPDYKERTFYLSGPNAMVQVYKELLSKLGIPKNHIVTDYFPGF